MHLLNIFIFGFGLIIGSFLNVVIFRMEKSESLGGRSYCLNCKSQLSWRDLIPVLSFIFLGGKCRYCKTKVSLQYPIVEILTALTFLLIVNYQATTTHQFPISNLLNTIFLIYIFSSLIVIFFYDSKHYIIPDKVLFPAIVISFIYRFLDFKNLDLIVNWPSGFWISIPILNYLFAALLASGFFLIIYLISKGQWMGFGDVKLAILLGLIVGFPIILVALFLAFFFGAIIGIIVILFKKGGLRSQLPFAPFLILGSFIALFWGQKIIDLYMNFHASIIF